MTKDYIRRCRFRPYAKGQGPTFTLTLWDAPNGLIKYELKMGRETLFEGSDFGASPLHADDSDETVKACMGFLTLKPGDTDREFFEHYTTEQLDYCCNHAEALAAEVYSRFGDE